MKIQFHEMNLLAQRIHHNTVLYLPLPTRTTPRSDFNKHAKEQLSFGDSESFLLILLLPKEHQTIAIF